MNITILQSTELSIIHGYLNFNRIQYDLTDLWQQDLDVGGRCIIGPELAEDSNRLLILDYKMFHTMCQWPMSLTQIIKFCNNNNTIWIWNDADGLMNTIINIDHILLAINDKIPNGSIKLFLDGEWLNQQSLNKLSNIQHRIFPYNSFLNSARLENANCNKVDCSKDFMLTTIKKHTRPHREILIKQINLINGLSEKGHINYSTLGSKRIGLQPHQHSWADGYPSMDLYQDSWLEIVPESLFQDGLFITEKTVKPIMTKTPFLVVSTCRYLEYLRRHGFKTFGDIIDESYDEQPQVEDRIRLMLAQLCDIIQNGSESFYKECQSVLDHNQNRLFEISGRKEYDMDIFISANLAEVGIS